MKSNLRLLLLAWVGCPAFAAPSLTIYNQDFALVRETVPLDLKAGETTVAYSGVTVHVEPDSVVLRDPTGRRPVTILEQSYRADALSPGLLLAANEGKEIDFLVRNSDGSEHTIRGRIIRSGYVPNTSGSIRYGSQFYAQQQRMGSMEGGAGTPIIEVGGQLRFSLPGEPLFPSLGDDSILKPTLTWKLGSPVSARFDGELSYVTGGMNWQASYNLVAPENGDTLSLNGWVTIDNQSGSAFDQATVKLMAGNVNKVQPVVEMDAMTFASAGKDETGTSPPVSEKAFDEYHLYSISRPISLRNRETKQVEFVHSEGIKSKTIYVYDGADMAQYRGFGFDAMRTNADFGTRWNSKVSVMREFKNSEENGLGIPLPGGRVRFYRRDNSDGQLEFTGENTIEHTPKDETLRVYSGDAFDLVGERRQTNFVHHRRPDWSDESFEIRLRNHKSTPAEVQVFERLYRGANWAITEESEAHEKVDADHVRFTVSVPAGGETVVTYRVHYRDSMSTED